MSNKSKLKIHPINLIILVIIIVAIAILGYFSIFNRKNNSNSQDEVNNANTKLYTPTDHIEAQKIKDADVLDSVLRRINMYNPKKLNSILGISTEINELKSFIARINLLLQKYSGDTAFTKKINNAYELVKQKQRIFFPVFREAYSKTANHMMNADSINCNTSGTNNVNIIFIGDRYLDSVNVQNDYDFIRPHLELLRYKQVIFKTKSENDTSKSFILNSNNDEDPL